jgi:hypothetical protein
MPYLNRDSFIALLDRLGSTDDAEVLASAREIDRRMRESGVSWNDLLVPPPAGVKDEDGYRGAFTDDDLLDLDPPRRAGGYGDDVGLIDELLAQPSLNAETRQELLDFKSDIADGEFTDMDSRYLRDLHNRLTRKARKSA